ncbi:aminopeptidase N [Glaciecola sp. 1036]|uniref:aminopeptidase N n=1 Tax=Alteromonadaceae TaxID=72275 RepID=UPI003CFC4223
MSVAISKKRLDYQAPDYVISETHLAFSLSPEKTKVTSSLKVTRNHPEAQKIKLDGENLILETVRVNEQLLVAGKDYEVATDYLEINADLDSFTLEIETLINPAGNTTLEGLYFVQDTFCSQCEAEGFRRITYYLDRPDVLSVFTVSITADAASYPYLLSNGNLVSEEIKDTQKTVVWHDPHPKPSYLFALVAGNFDLLTDHFTTSEGREVELQLYVELGRKHQGQFALDSLKRAMQWDQDTFGLAYDLDIYMVVAVDFFNMGAMENKGLNVFNSKFVLAEPATATDEDYFNIESIIAHEYFHNWTGNRVTCRDWFQLSLKEGLTVFRDQKFSADMSSELSTRISQVKVIKEYQFAEDAGPMSHPIRPDEVMEMNNFYTVTVYDKGAEVIRMLHTLLGVDGFRKGMDLYFKRHDGQAVTCDDFVQAMQDVTEVDLTQFRRWYSQSGTPLISVVKSVDSDGTEFIISQQNPATADQKDKQDLFIPLAMSVIDKSGNEHLVANSAENNLVVDSAKVQVNTSYTDVVPVLNDNFSAPVIVDYEYTNAELLDIVKFSSSDYAKWDAAQRLYSAHILALYNQSQQSIDEDINALADYLINSELSDDVIAEILTLPSFESLSIGLQKIDPLSLHNAIREVNERFANALGEKCFEKVLATETKSAYAYEQSQVHARKANKAWLLLAGLNDKTASQSLKWLTNKYKTSDNMTEKLNCLKVAQQINLDVFDNLMQAFEESYGSDSVVMDKWFSLHATTEREDILSRITLLEAHSAYIPKNPNKIRALYSTFGHYNIAGFHQLSGEGYKCLASKIIEVDKINPQVASRLITPLLQFKRYATKHRELMEGQLQRIFNAKGLSKDLFEKTSKALIKN